MKLRKIDYIIGVIAAIPFLAVVIWNSITSAMDISFFALYFVVTIMFLSLYRKSPSKVIYLIELGAMFVFSGFFFFLMFYVIEGLTSDFISYFFYSIITVAFFVNTVIFLVLFIKGFTKE